MIVKMLVVAWAATTYLTLAISIPSFIIGIFLVHIIKVVFYEADALKEKNESICLFQFC